MTRCCSKTGGSPNEDRLQPLGLLGPGIADTPDGGRSHRRTLIDAITATGHQVVFLQANRDLDDAGDDLTDTYRWDAGLPTIDLLFLEWRWPISGRNTTPCGTPGHTCDLHRQRELVEHYTRIGTPTVIWDKDRRLPAEHRLRRWRNVVVCEAALHPGPGAETLLFPVADEALDAADPAHLASQHRYVPLAYVGNQYDRDEAFTAYFAPAADRVRHVVAGKWTETRGWPHVNFVGRIAFLDVEALYRRSLSTVLLLPDRYARSGQMTQRLIESVVAGCLPLTPTSIRSAARFTPTSLHIRNGADALSKIDLLVRIAGTSEHVMLLEACLAKLDLFRATRQLRALERVFDRLTAPAVPR